MVFSFNRDRQTDKQTNKAITLLLIQVVGDSLNMNPDINTLAQLVEGVERSTLTRVKLIIV